MRFRCWNSSRSVLQSRLLAVAKYHSRGLLNGAACPFSVVSTPRLILQHRLISTRSSVNDSRFCEFSGLLVEQKSILMRSISAQFLNTIFSTGKHLWTNWDHWPNFPCFPGCFREDVLNPLVPSIEGYSAGDADMSHRDITGHLIGPYAWAADKV